MQDNLTGPAALLAGAPAVAAVEPAAGPSAFWAVRPGIDVAGLLSDIALTDHRRTSEGRSYWWVAGLPEPVAAEEPPEPDEMESVVTEAAETAETDAEHATKATPAEPDPWELADLPEPDVSPFAAAVGGFSLFAPPEPGTIETVEPPAVAYISPAPRVLWSQVWAGPGLPSGDVLAWFFRGHAGND